MVTSAAVIGSFDPILVVELVGLVLVVVVLVLAMVVEAVVVGASVVTPLVGGAGPVVEPCIRSAEGWLAHDATTITITATAAIPTVVLPGPTRSRLVVLLADTPTSCTLPTGAMGWPTQRRTSKSDD